MEAISRVMDKALRQKLLQFLNVPLPSYYAGRSFETGKKYLKIFNILSNGQHSAINFLDPVTGNLYKAKSWKQKGRLVGNLFAMEL